MRFNPIRPMILTIGLLFCLVSPGLVSPALAQPVHVTVGAERGQGLIFRDGNICVLVTAGHLAEGDAFGSFGLVVAGQPVQRGFGNLVAPFWEGLDLAIATVSGPAAGPETCRLTYQDLARPWGAGTPRGSMRLPHVAADGGLVRNPMRLIKVDQHATFAAEFTDDTRPRRGRSGGFLFAGDRPIGMVTDLDDVETDAGLSAAHLFIRSEEVAMNARRWLDFEGVSLSNASDPVTARQEAGYSVRVQSTTLTPFEANQNVENVLVDNAPFLFRGTGEIILIVEGDAARTLRGVTITSEGQEVAPKDITINTDTRTSGGFVPRWFRSGVMQQSGDFDTGERSGRTIRRIQIVIGSAWGGDPRRIDRITLY